MRTHDPYAKSDVSKSNDTNMTNSSTQTADIVEILKHIPHRYPFLLIDRMEACEPNKSVRVIKNVSNSDVTLMGGGKGVFPQLLVVEALAQAAGALCYYSGMMSNAPRAIMFFAGVDDCRFGRDAYRGDQIRLDCTLRRSMRGVAKLHGKATIRDEIVVEASLTAVVRNVGDSQPPASA